MLLLVVAGVQGPHGGRMCRVDARAGAASAHVECLDVLFVRTCCACSAMLRTCVLAAWRVLGSVLPMDMRDASARIGRAGVGRRLAQRRALRQLGPEYSHIYSKVIEV